MFVVIKDQGKFRMNCRGVNRKMWYGSVLVHERNGMEYYFEVNMISEVEGIALRYSLSSPV